MNNILEHMLQPAQFVPATVEQFVAVQLARRLNDEPGLVRYVQYVTHHSTDYLVRLFHRAQQQTDPARAFHSSLAIPEP